MLIVMKFGGTSVGSAERIARAADLAVNSAKEGHRVVVVTSAMAGVTNKLVALTEQASATGDAGNRVAEYFRATKQLEQDHLAAARNAIRDAKLVEEPKTKFGCGRWDQMLLDRFQLSIDNGAAVESTERKRDRQRRNEP